MAVDRYSLFGAAFVEVSINNMETFELLGYTEQGVDMTISEAKTEIMTDLMGDKTPQDFQNMGALAKIVVPLIAYSETVLDSIITLNDSGVLGEIGTPGLVYGVNSLFISVGITGLFDSPWFFPYCLLNQEGTKLATKVNPFRLELTAWPFADIFQTSVTNNVLFDRSVPFTPPN